MGLQEKDFIYESGTISSSDVVHSMLKRYGKTDEDFARHIGVKPDFVKKYFMRQAGLDAELRQTVESVTGIPADLLDKLDQSFIEHQRKHDVRLSYDHSNELYKAPYEWVSAIEQINLWRNSMKNSDKFNESELYHRHNLSKEEFNTVQDQVLHHTVDYHQPFYVKTEDQEGKLAEFAVSSRAHYDRMRKSVDAFDEQMISDIKNYIPKRNKDYDTVLKFLNYDEEVFEAEPYNSTKRYESTNAVQHLRFDNIHMHLYSWLQEHTTIRVDNEAEAKLIVAESKGIDLATIWPLSDEDKTKYYEFKAELDKKSLRK